MKPATGSAPLDLPDQITKDLGGAGEVDVAQWRVSDATLTALLAGLGRALGAWETQDFVDKQRLSFAVGDEIVYPEDSDQAKSLMAGNTAIIQRLERSDPVFSTAVNKISKAAKARLVSISAYISSIDSRAFSWHVDKWDNIVIQLHGSKVFDLPDGGSRSLIPGDALFLAEDVSHRTRTIERSVHLSVAVFPETSSR